MFLHSDERNSGEPLACTNCNGVIDGPEAIWRGDPYHPACARAVASITEAYECLRRAWG